MHNNHHAILIVDDELLNLDMLGRRLQRDGYLISLADSGPKALAMMKMERFDLVLLDVNMPKMDGFQVLQTIKADPITKRTSVIMATALNDRESVIRCIQHGAEDYLVKPFDMALVKARVARCLQGRGHAPGIADPLDEEAAKDARVLIVEDNDLNLELLTRRVGGMGCVVTGSPSGEDAWKHLQESTFDLILLDIMMPGMSGIELLTLIKKDPRHQGTPVLMISALDDSETMATCFEIGATDYIRKPVTPVLLKARVLSSLRAKRAHDAEQQNANKP